MHARIHLGTRKEIQVSCPGAKNTLRCSYGHSTWAKCSCFYPKSFPLAKQCTFMIGHFVIDTDKPLQAKSPPLIYPEAFCEARVMWISFAEIKQIFANQTGISQESSTKKSCADSRCGRSHVVPVPACLLGCRERLDLLQEQGDTKSQTWRSD